MMEEILKVEHLQKIYGNRGYGQPVLDDITFTVKKGNCQQVDTFQNSTKERNDT